MVCEGSGLVGWSSIQVSKRLTHFDRPFCSVLTSFCGTHMVRWEMKICSVWFIAAVAAV